MKRVVVVDTFEKVRQTNKIVRIYDPLAISPPKKSSRHRCAFNTNKRASFRESMAQYLSTK